MGIQKEVKNKGGMVGINTETGKVRMLHVALPPFMHTLFIN